MWQLLSTNRAPKTKTKVDDDLLKRLEQLEALVAGLKK